MEEEYSNAMVALQIQDCKYLIYFNGYRLKYIKGLTKDTKIQGKYILGLCNTFRNSEQVYNK